MTAEELAPLPIPANTKFWNFFERVLWTLIQAASAEGLITIWEAVYGDLGDNKAAWVIALTAILAAVKNGITQTFFSPTGATLPESIAPIPAEKVAVEERAGLLIASHASPIANGTPVDVWKVAA